MRRSRILLLALGAVHATAACLSAQEPEIVSGEVTCGDCVITLDTVVTIGGLDGPGLHVVTRYSHVAVDRRGRILVADVRQSEISVFDSTGSFLRTVGRQGERPGEYGLISHIGVGPKYIHVFEYHSGRTVLDHEFAVIRTDRFPGQILSAAVMSDNNVVFVAGVPTPGSVGHKLHILHPSGQIQSFGDDGGVYSSQLTRWTSQRSSVTGRGDTVWAVKKDANRIVRWDLGQEPRVGRLFEREVVEFDEGAPAELVYPRSLNLAASLDDRGLWIIWIAPDPEWAERVPPGGDETPAPPREVYDSWLDLVDPVTGRTIARHRHDGYLKDFVAGSSYVAEYHETDAGVPLLHVLEPRLSICSTTGSLRAQEPERVSGAVSCDMCRITMDTIASLGGPEGQGLGVVTELSVVAVDGRGRFLIAELRQNEFSVFDASGKFIRTVGRQGEGPGEYQIGISQIAVGPQFIHVFESHRGRTLLDHAFNVVRTDRFPGQIIHGYAYVADSGDVVTMADIPTPEAVRHNFHILNRSGEIMSFGGNRAPDGFNVTGYGETMWAVQGSVTRVVRWRLGAETPGL